MTHRSFKAIQPLDVVARGLMDKGHSLGPREDRFHEYTRLVRGESEITIYACGCIRAEDDNAARTLMAVCRGAE